MKLGSTGSEHAQMKLGLELDNCAATGYRAVKRFTDN